ncbi:hypothetical protein PsorP6_017385 [Peronosclerospora sorghi]|uniref:Uncharacterized protein n=1 Tax=Peronosclerospora sorghi TaxID=230839 RepID=A0ACC0WLN6_9STRA|nr:hypothetical protein PsorP6_017385 [Peronosclerospora sorghi]
MSTRALQDFGTRHELTKCAIAFALQELVEEILQIACNTGTNVCSMLADLRRGSRTEIDAISGRIVAGGKRHGVPTPINELLLLLVKALEKEGTRRRTSLP